MKSANTRFSLPSRALHWLMAPLLLAMLLIGVGMISTLSSMRPLLVDIHKPLGLALLVLAVLRLLLRLTGKAPALPSTMPTWQRHAAGVSHWLLYGAMLAMPLLGWAMLSAGGYPLPGFSGTHLPPLVSQNVTLYANLRLAHGIVGKVFFALILVHIAAGLLHALVLKDGVFASIAPRSRSAGR
jgi:cytochrome b561